MFKTIIISVASTRAHLHSKFYAETNMHCLCSISILTTFHNQCIPIHQQKPAPIPHKTHVWNHQDYPFISSRIQFRGKNLAAISNSWRNRVYPVQEGYTIRTNGWVFFLLWTWLKDTIGGILSLVFFVISILTTCTSKDKGRKGSKTAHSISWHPVSNPPKLKNRWSPF